jgi:large subunit ribosomal protein L10
MANQAKLEMKKNVVSEITNKFQDSSSVIFFDYRGLSDEELTELRRKLKDSATEMKVYKNTLTKRALDNMQLVMEECVQGPSAVAFSKDVIAPIKILSDYAKEHVALSIKGGIVDGKASTIDAIAKLATIPSREGLLTMLAGGMIGIARDLSIALNMYADQKNN